MKTTEHVFDNYVNGYKLKKFETAICIHADCFEWMGTIPKNSIHAIVTDPPYGVKEYDFDQLEKRENGNGGVWRIPPSFDGHVRSPLPRFTALDENDKKRLERFFYEWGLLVNRVLRPGGHLLIASNSFLSLLVFKAIASSGLEFRGQVMRVVRTLRGGDRPKNAEQEFGDVCSMPRGCYEPWGLFRKRFDGTVAECLKKHETGGLRRLPDGRPFCDLIYSERTPQSEREFSDHPSLKPQSLMRQLVYASLPLGKGIVLDPFMGSGSTLAAAQAIGYNAIGIERHIEYFDNSGETVPALSSIHVKQEECSENGLNGTKISKNNAQCNLMLELS